MLEPWPQFSSRAKECGLGAISQTGETTEREREREKDWVWGWTGMLASSAEPTDSNTFS